MGLELSVILCGWPFILTMQAFFDRSNTGDLISRLVADCGEMAGGKKLRYDH